MLDDRSLAWLLLLPSIQGKRVLAAGLNEQQVDRLSRHCGSMDWLSGEKNQPSLRLPDTAMIRENSSDLTGPYDMIVLGEGSESLTPDRLLADDGVVVSMEFVGSPWSAHRLREHGFVHSMALGCLPNDAPRLFVPLGGRRVLLHGLRMHTPGSRKSRMALKLLQGMACLGNDRLLRRRGVVFAARQPEHLSKPGLCEWLQEQLGRSINALVVYAGSESPRRKSTLLAISEGEPYCIIKAADTELGSIAIHEESEALRAVSSEIAFGQVPEVLHEGKWGTWAVQVQSLLPRVRGKQCRRLAEEHWRFLNQLCRLGQQALRLDETDCWHSVQESSQDESAPEVVRQAMAYLSMPEVAGIQIVCHRSHGDFVPWNIHRRQDRMAVFDWEDSRPVDIPGRDIFHFLFRMYVLPGPWPGDAAFTSEVLTEAKNHQQLSSLSQKTIAILLLLWLIREWQYSGRAQALGALQHVMELCRG